MLTCNTGRHDGTIQNMVDDFSGPCRWKECERAAGASRKNAGGQKERCYMEYRTTIRAGHSEMGPHGRMKIVSVANRFQDAAGEHADKLGLGVRDLLAKGYTWVLHRYRLVFDRLPECGENLRIRTWYRPEKNLYSLRNFIMEEEGGAELVFAQSSWIVVNLARGRPVRLDSVMPASYEKNQSADLAVRFPDIPRLGEPDHGMSFSVRLHDLDVNRHVNNARYIEWAVETLPPEVLEEMVPAVVDAVFKNSAGYGDRIQSWVCRLDDAPAAFCHRLTDAGGSDCSLLRTEWRAHQA
ncbi:MAG: acyl-[acyl-carrier-protein] thioesterase [Thermovirgaceae bacterium]